MTTDTRRRPLVFLRAGEYRIALEQTCICRWEPTPGCERCDGTGIVLSDDGRKLLEFLDRYRGSMAVQP